MVVLNKMEQNRLDKEKIMLSNIEKNINSTFFINILRDNWNKNHSIYSIGNLIGELYIHHIINKDGYGFEKYITQINELYTQLEERQISPQNFETQKSKLIATVIADKLNIDYTINKGAWGIGATRHSTLPKHVYGPCIIGLANEGVCQVSKKYDKGERRQSPIV